jgi:hypothetical protein
MSKELIKQFLKPDWRKIVIFLPIFIVSLFLVYNTGKCPPKVLCEFPANYYQGIPRPINNWREYPNELENNMLTFRALKKGNVSNTFSLFLNIIFWYVISCFLISIWDKIKVKKIIIS